MSPTPVSASLRRGIALAFLIVTVPESLVALYGCAVMTSALGDFFSSGSERIALNLAVGYAAFCCGFWLMRGYYLEWRGRLRQCGLFWLASLSYNVLLGSAYWEQLMTQPAQAGFAFLFLVAALIGGGMSSLGLFDVWKNSAYGEALPLGDLFGIIQSYLAVPMILAILVLMWADLGLWHRHGDAGAMEGVVVFAYLAIGLVIHVGHWLSERLRLPWLVIHLGTCICYHFATFVVLALWCSGFFPGYPVFANPLAVLASVFLALFVTALMSALRLVLTVEQGSESPFPA